jgi:hypothetical protein
MNKSFLLELPNGMTLVAETGDNPDYPDIRISLIAPGRADELLCFAECNSSKPEGKEVCIGAYTCGVDEPSYYESYFSPGSPSANA